MNVTKGTESDDGIRKVIPRKLTHETVLKVAILSF